jgi:hypothetical protein
MESLSPTFDQMGPNNVSVRLKRARKIYQALGFRRGYAFILCMSLYSL